MASNDNVVPIPMSLLRQDTLRKPAPQAAPLPPAEDVKIEADAPDGARLDPKTGALIIDAEDGAVIIDLNPKPDIPPERRNDFNTNLAELIDPAELAQIADELLRGIQFDEQSRAEWLETRAQGIRILGFKIEPPRSSIDSTAAMDGMSNVRHPLLTEAVLRFQANARGELLPSDGPVKTMNLGESEDGDSLAEQLEEGLNFYLTTIATEYYPDTDRLLLYVGFGGCGFKKVYNCPVRRRPVSESIDAKDLIISNAATDMRNAARVTHQITMRPNMLKRMQLAGAYRDVPISAPSGVVLNPVDRQIADMQGVQPLQQQTEDRDHTIYETYSELNIRGFEDKAGGKETGLALPYRVVIEKDSRQVLEVRRNWDKDDETKLTKIPFVKYPFVPGLGFYDIGLIHILGNTTNALTAAWRELLDAGMFANFPGFLYAKPYGRQATNEFRVPPGGGVAVQIEGDDINKAIMPLPYKDPSEAFAKIVDNISETGQRLGGTAELKVAEGRQDAPVGTTLAMIEQAGKVESAVHKRLTAAQAEEFQLLKQCFRENPEAFIVAMKRKGNSSWSEERFLAALNNADIVPMADPNTPSHMHRLMKAVALVQLNGAFPGLFDPRKLIKRVGDMARIPDIEQVLNNNPGGTGMSPEIELQLKQIADKGQERQARAQESQGKIVLQQMEDANEERQQQHELLMQHNENQDEAAERESRSQLAEVGFREALVNAHAEVSAESIRARSEQSSSDASVKVAQHGVTAAKHGVEAARHQAKAKTQVAKKPPSKPKSKA